MLNQPERAALAAAAKPKQDDVGWRMVEDPATGARLGIPAKLVPNTQVSGGIGSWSVVARRISGRDLPHRAARHDARRRVRADEEGAGRPQDRLQRAAAGFLRHLRPAGPEEILRARAAARRRGARHHHPLRSGDGRHHGAGGGRDVERLCGVSGRRGARRRRAARSSTRAASWSAPATSSPAARRSTAAMSSPSRASAAPIASAEDKASGLALLRVYGARSSKPVALAGARRRKAT